MPNDKVLIARIRNAGLRDAETGMYPGLRPKASTDAAPPTTACGYLLSVGNEDCTGAHLQASFAALLFQDQYHTINVVAAGSLQRWNIESSGVSKELAYRLAVLQERACIAECLEVLTQFQGPLAPKPAIAVTATETRLTSGKDPEPSNGEILKHLGKIRLPTKPKSEAGLIAWSRQNHVFAQVKLQITPTRIVTVNLYSWDSLRTKKDFIAYTKDYNQAISPTSSELSTQQAFSKAIRRTIQDFVRHKKFNSPAEKQRCEDYSEKFLSEEVPIPPMFLKMLNCSDVYYPGKCSPAFQQAYTFYELGSHKKSWRPLDFKNKQFEHGTLERVKQIWEAPKPRDVAGHAEVFRQHLDSIVLQKIFHEKFPNFLNPTLIPMPTVRNPQNSSSEVDPKQLIAELSRITALLLGTFERPDSPKSTGNTNIRALSFCHAKLLDVTKNLHLALLKAESKAESKAERNPPIQHPKVSWNPNRSPSHSRQNSACHFYSLAAHHSKSANAPHPLQGKGLVGAT